LLHAIIEEDETMATKKWFGTIYRWENPNIKFTLSPDYTVPEGMLADIDFKVNMSKGVVIHDPDGIVGRYFRVDGVAVLDTLTLMKIDSKPTPSVLYTCEVLVQDPYHDGVILKSGPLLMRLPTEKLQCKDFQTFMSVALR
jgi:hypothetical protein